MLLVEKLSPRFGAEPHRGDLVFFQPPPRLREIADNRRVAAGQTVLDTGTLFVKRIVAVPGDTVGTDAHPNPRPYKPLVALTLILIPILTPTLTLTPSPKPKP